MNEEIIVTPEIMPPSTVIQQEAAAMIDMQITTAKRYPRTLSLVKEKVRALGTVDQETAQACHYALPRGKGKDRKILIGPGIRLAEIVVACYGNIRAKWYTVSEEEKTVTVRGACWDLESNVASEVEVKRSIWGKHGRYSQDMITVTTNAAGAIAYRNAVFKVIPMALFGPEIAAIKHVAAGEGKSLDEMRQSCTKKFKDHGINQKEMCSLVSKRKAADLDIDDIVVLGGMYTALDEGSTTKADLFKDGDSNDTSNLKAGKSKIGKETPESGEQEETPEATEEIKGFDE